MSTRLHADRLGGIPPTIFSAMSALAVRTGAVNLGQGFPDTDGPGSVVAAAARAMQDGANQYAPGLGVPALRQAIAPHQQRHYGIGVGPHRQVVGTTGCTGAGEKALKGSACSGSNAAGAKRSSRRISNSQSMSSSGSGF